MIFLFDLLSFISGLETELVIVLFLVVISTQWRIYSDYRSFYSRTNRFEDYFEMHRHFLENRKVYQMNDEALKELKDGMNELKEKIVHLENNLKNNSDPSKLLDAVNKLHDRFDELKK